MTAVQAVEHADDDERGPRRRGSIASSPRDDAHSGALGDGRVGATSGSGSASATSVRGRCAAIAPRCVSGARRAPCAGAARPATARHTAATRPSGPTASTIGASRIGERRLRGGDQALAEAPDLVVGDVRVRQVLQAGVDRPQDRARRPPVRRRRAARRSSSGDGVLEPEAARGGAHQRPEVRARARAASPRSRASARMYVPAEHATSTTAIGRAGSASSHSTRSSAWITTSRAGELDGLARARQLVRAPALRSGPRCSPAGPG